MVPFPVSLASRLKSRLRVHAYKQTYETGSDGVCIGD